MKTITKKLTMILFLFLPLFLLTSCVEGLNMSFVEFAVRSWATEHKLMENGTWQPTYLVAKTAEERLADLTNQEKAVQLTGLDVVREIEKADDLAWHARRTNDPKEMEQALEARPGDWRLQEQNAALWLQNANSAAANNAITESDILLQKSMQGENCVALRKQQLEYREKVIRSSLGFCLAEDDCDQSSLDLELTNTREELQGIYGSGTTAFCD